MKDAGVMAHRADVARDLRQMEEARILYLRAIDLYRKGIVEPGHDRYAVKRAYIQMEICERAVKDIDDMKADYQKRKEERNKLVDD